MSWLILSFVLLESSTFLLFKFLINANFHPYLLVSLSTFISSILLLIWYLPKKSFKSQVFHLTSVKASLPTALFIGLGNVFGFLALKYILATKYIFLNRTSVLLSPILAFWLMKEKINHKIWPLIGLTIIGIWLLAGNIDTNINWFGTALALLTAITVSLDFIYQKKAMIKLLPEVMAFWRRFLSGFVTLSMWLILPKLGVFNVSLIPYVLLLSLGFFAMSICLAKALKKHKVGEFNLLINLTPVLASLGAMILLKEMVTSHQMIGAGLILGSIVIYNLITNYDPRHNFGTKVNRK
jgi:drug/metabolite transporter (DMT)-like permease